MKKSLLISLGIIILIAVIGVWAYLFTFGAPKDSGEIFANFGITGETVVPIEQGSPTVDVDGINNTGAHQPLRQLTTKPVAGAGFAQGEIRYVEQGTGHIYAIDLTTGTESLLSGTTIPSARAATFSDDGEYVAIATLDGTAEKTLAGTIENNEQFSGVTLPEGAANVGFGSATGTLYYALHTNDGTTGYSYNLVKETSDSLFTAPIRDIRVLWGNPTMVYTTPTAEQLGYVYRVDGTSLGYITDGGYGLMGISYHGDLITTTSGTEGIRSVLTFGDGSTVTQALPLIPEKCAAKGDALYCAVPSEELSPRSFPDDWYKGTTSYSDILWHINPVSGQAAVLSDFRMESGREIDVARMGTDETGNLIYFINKNDNTLWMFDTTL